MSCILNRSGYFRSPEKAACDIRKDVDALERNSPIKLVDVWNTGPELYLCQQSVKEINTILDEAKKGILDSYSALCMIDSILVYHNVSTHRSVTGGTGSTLLNSTRDLSATRDCKSCRIIMPDDIRTDRKELLCYNGETWLRLPVSKVPRSTERETKKQ